MAERRKPMPQAEAVCCTFLLLSPIAESYSGRASLRDLFGQGDRGDPEFVEMFLRLVRPQDDVPILDADEPFEK